MVNLFIKLCSITVSPLVLSSDHHQLPSQTNCLPDLLRLVEPQPVPVLTEGGGVEGHLPGQSDLAVALVQVDVGLVQEEGQYAGVESVCDEDFSHTHQSNGASKVLHVVKMFVQFTLDFVLEVRSNRTLNTGIKKLFSIPPINKFKTEM